MLNSHGAFFTYFWKAHDGKNAASGRPHETNMQFRAFERPIIIYQESTAKDGQSDKRSWPVPMTDADSQHAAGCSQSRSHRTPSIVDFLGHWGQSLKMSEE